jgi:hypothetical protein
VPLDYRHPDGGRIGIAVVRHVATDPAHLAVIRADLAEPAEPGRAGSQLVTSANEIRRMFAMLCGPPPQPQHARRWSRWRHRHQERSRHCHYQRQHQQDH